MRDYQELIEKIDNLRVAVLGDAVLDRYIYGNVERISREAPIPVFEVIGVEERLGGACNTALNIRQLVSNVFVCSIISPDTFGNSLENLMQKFDIKIEYLKIDPRVRTTVKDRYISKKQQMFRADIEDQGQLPDDVVHSILEGIKNLLNEVDLFVASDHCINFFSERVFKLFEELHASGKVNLQNKPFYLDTRSNNYHYVKYASLYKVNQADASAILGRKIETLNDLHEFSAKVFAEKTVELVVVTLGEKGSYLNDGSQGELFDAQRVEISDVSGAGDTFLAMFSLVHYATKDFKLASRLANRASARVVQRFGTSFLTKSEFLSDLQAVLI
ncbi:MAG: PfkB family carbohydrate kinase [Deltaproteobacteria bacterium]|nr:PfkB family carbohydrate kinase [Deltaproteobacteria bacterium]MCX7952748.1 PfkB family carbohydrate kinase [Deltaproteobacteria bacterium]